MAKIFIVEDDLALRSELVKLLTSYKHVCEVTDDFEGVIETLSRVKCDLILLDINLPYYDGYHICRAVRELASTPIIVMTSRNTEMDELMGMNLGADDFITKPFNTQILLARINAVLKRYFPKGASEELSVFGLTLDLSTSVVKHLEASVELTKNEQRILATFMKNAGKIITRDEIMNVLWQSEAFVDDNTLTVNINRLRKKLSDIGANDIIQTKRGLGYMLCEF